MQKHLLFWNLYIAGSVSQAKTGLLSHFFATQLVCFDEDLVLGEYIGKKKSNYFRKTQKKILKKNVKKQ